MALVSVGTLTANFDTRDEMLFPEIAVKKDTGYLLFARTVPISVNTPDQYLLIIPVIESEYGVFESPLDCKFFPKERGYQFTVGVPDSDADKDQQLRILMLPREFVRGRGQVRSFDVELLFEDDKELDSTVPVG